MEMFSNKTNADGVSLYQFPADESVRRQWLLLFDGHHLRVTFVATISQLTDKGFGAKNAFITMLKRRNREHKLYDL